MTGSFQGIKVVHDETMGSNEVAIEFHPGDAAPPPHVLRVSGSS